VDQFNSFLTASQFDTPLSYQIKQMIATVQQQLGLNV